MKDSSFAVLFTMSSKHAWPGHKWLVPKAQTHAQASLTVATNDAFNIVQACMARTEVARAKGTNPNASKLGGQLFML